MVILRKLCYFTSVWLKCQEFFHRLAKSAGCNIKCERTRTHPTGCGTVLSHLFFCLCLAGKDNGNGVKDGATLQIYNLFGPERDCRAVSGERPPGGHCRKNRCFHGGDLSGIEARGNCRRGRRAGSGPEPAAGLQPGYRPADSTGEFQATGPDPDGQPARRFRR